MDIEKAKELLEKIRHYLVIGRDEGTGELIAEIDDLLDEPVCKTCGGKGVITEIIALGEGFGETEEVPCPICQQPPASDIRKKLHELGQHLTKECTC